MKMGDIQHCQSNIKQLFSQRGHSTGDLARTTGQGKKFYQTRAGRSFIFGSEDFKYI
jgi:hypothetical protein